MLSIKQRPLSTNESFELSSDRHLGLANIISDRVLGGSRLLNSDWWFKWLGVNGDVNIDSLSSEKVLLNGD